MPKSPELAPGRAAKSLHGTPALTTERHKAPESQADFPNVEFQESEFLKNEIPEYAYLMSASKNIGS